MEQENKALEDQIRQMSKSMKSKKALSPGKYDKYVQQSEEIKSLHTQVKGLQTQLDEKEEKMRQQDLQQKKRTKEMTEQRSKLALLTEQKSHLSQELNYQLQLKGDQDFQRNKKAQENKQKDSQISSLRQIH